MAVFGTTSSIPKRHKVMPVGYFLGHTQRIGYFLAGLLNILNTVFYILRYFL
jgi:hypothetical protein